MYAAIALRYAGQREKGLIHAAPRESMIPGRDNFDTSQAKWETAFVTRPPIFELSYCELLSFLVMISVAVMFTPHGRNSFGVKKLSDRFDQ